MTEAALGRVAIVLVEPQLGRNIGAAARAMANFGLSDLRLVAPRDGWPNPEAEATASGAPGVLEAARVYATTAEACADLAYVYATTARSRELTKRVLTPEAAATDVAARLDAGAPRVGFLFGRERTGLESHDVVAANAIVTVPTNPAFASLNLAQGVLLIGYELRRRLIAHPADVYETGPSGPASRATVDALYAHLAAELDAAGHFWPEDKRPAMEASLRNLLARTPLTDQDVRMLRGVVRSLADLRRRRGSGEPI